MNPISPQEQALKWLTEQLEALGAVRNSGPQYSAFKQWRQNTLTAVQRIWPNDPSRSERFCRIPFSISLAKPDEKAAREFFERGCAAARRLLKVWIAEIRLQGVAGAEQGRGRAAKPAPGTPAPAKPATAKPAAPKPRGSGASGEGPHLKDLLGLTGSQEGSSSGPSRLSGKAPDALSWSIDDALRHVGGEPATGPDEGAPASSPRPRAQTGKPDRARARELADLVSEIDGMDIPPSDRELVRITLLDLARQVDSGHLTWSILQHAVTLVMRFPGLARRAIPALLPYFEDAA